MTVTEFLERFPNYDATPRQKAAAMWLEYIGGKHKFLVTFGFENAEAQLWGNCDDPVWMWPETMWSVQ